MRKSLVKCPAKLNLFLSVGSPDENGYHPLRTVFQAISLFDDLEIQASPDGQDQIWSDEFELPLDNSLAKTLRLAREIGPVPPLSIQLRKRIPVEAGLGGGSSDAAGLLRWLGQFVPSAFPAHSLRDLAFAVGADVSFFLVGGACRATGYGEALTPLDDEPKKWVVVVKPELGSSTAAAYQALDKEKRTWLDFPASRWALMNDFELVMPEVCGDLIEALGDAGCSSASLSGSGSAVFGLAESEEEAFAIAQQLSDMGQTWSASTLTREESVWIQQV